MKEIIIAYDENTEASPVMGDWVGELVRCKDCKHGYKCEFSIRCENKNMPSMFGQHFSENWFCADGEKDGSQTKRPKETFWDSLSEADLMEPMHHFED